jgi:23S rRNA (cytosine1962-C5)-methyltransferase
LLSVILKKGREVPVLRGHPWIFSGAIDRIENNAAAVGVADVFDWEKQWIARGLFSPKSNIRVRVLTSRKEAIDRDFFYRRLSQALFIREKLLSEVTNAYRIVNGEGDFLPGLIVDRYNEFLVCQFFTAGMDCFKPLRGRHRTVSRRVGRRDAS